MIDVYRHEKVLMRRTLISLFLLSILMNSSLVSAEPPSLPPRGVLVGIWEARYKTYYYGEQFDVLTVAQSGQHLSGTYQGYDDFPEDHGPWYFFVRIEELTMKEDGPIMITIGPRNFFNSRPKSVTTGLMNRIEDSIRLQGNLGSDGLLSLDCSSEAKVCPFEGTRVYKKRRD